MLLTTCFTTANLSVKLLCYHCYYQHDIVHWKTCCEGKKTRSISILKAQHHPERTAQMQCMNQGMQYSMNIPS